MPHLRDPLPHLGRTFRQRVRDHLARRRGLPVAYDYPHTVQIVPTNACNYRCRACPKSVFPTDNRMLDPAVYARVREQLLPHARLVDLQGLGEPMMSPLFLTMLADARDMGLEVRFTTNGSLVNRESAAEVAASPVRLVLSIDGATARTHEDSRPGADFGQLLDALRAIRDAAAAPAAHPLFRFEVNTVVTRRNLDEVAGVLELAAAHGARAVDLIAPGMGAREDPFARDTIGRHEALFAARLPGIRDAAERLGVAVTVPPFLAQAGGGDLSAAPADASVGAMVMGPVGPTSPVRPRTSILPSSPSPPPTPPPSAIFPQQCPDPWRTVYVDVDGWVRPCCRALNIGMGNILDTHFWDIWNGPHYLRLRQALCSDAPPSFCRDCTLPWGITGGDSNYPAKLAKRGIVLPPAPEIGFSWDKQSRTLTEAGRR